MDNVINLAGAASESAKQQPSDPLELYTQGTFTIQFIDGSQLEGLEGYQSFSHDFFILTEVKGEPLTTNFITPMSNVRWVSRATEVQAD